MMTTMALEPPAQPIPARRERARVTLIAERADGQSVHLQVFCGESLLDACDGQDSPLPSCCRSAACGTCRVQVLEGAEHLSPPASDELDLLDVFDADPGDVRLACQARPITGGAVLRVRALET